jgi:hypothetical protein
LNVKIDTGIRDVSCGYTFRLDKDEAGRYVMRNIRGNHIAVVPKGRAGSEIGIRDSAPPSTTTVTTGADMKNLLKIVGLGFQNYAKDAKPEDVGELLQEMRDGDAVNDAAPVLDTKNPAFLAAVNAAVDAKMAAKDAEEEEEKKKKDDEEKAAKDAEKECESMADGEKEDEEATMDAEVLPPANLSETLFSIGDAAKHLGNLRKAVAKSKDQGAIDSYNALAKQIKGLKSGVKDGAIDPFAALTRPGNATVDAEPEVPMFMFFNGKSHEQGLKDWNEYQKSKGAR